MKAYLSTLWSGPSIRKSVFIFGGIGVVVLLVSFAYLVYKYFQLTKQIQNLNTQYYRSSYTRQPQPSTKPNIKLTSPPDLPYDHAVKPIDALKKSDAVMDTVVFVRENNVWAVQGGKEYQLTQDGISNKYLYKNPDSVSYRNPIVSPDKQRVLYIQHRFVDTKSNLVATFWWDSLITPGNPKQLTNQVNCLEQQIGWSADGNSIYCTAYHVTTESEPESASIAVMPLSGDDVNWIGEFRMGGGCGGGVEYPSGSLASLEGRGINPAFVATSDGKYLIHNTSCTGNGIFALDLETEVDKAIDKLGSSVVFSPSQKLLATISSDPAELASNKNIWQTQRHTLINLYHIGDWELVETFQSELKITSIAFGSDDNTLYFLTEEPNGEVLSLEARNCPGGTIYQTSVNKVTLKRVNITEDLVHEISTFNAYSGKLQQASKNAIFLTIIENPLRYFGYLVASRDCLGAEPYLPRINVIAVDAENGEYGLVIEGAQQTHVR
jgi:hypothetical protein